MNKFSMREKMTEQMEEWTGKFGEEYTDRNMMSPDEFDKLLHSRIGFSRTEQIDEFLSDLKLNNILEVGSNVGNQLLLLQKKGFKNLYGIELNRYAVEKAKERTKGIDIIQGSAFDIPFKDAYFDLVFTSGVLIHLSPRDINDVLDEIYRCSKKYIWGSEYFSENYIKVDYRGHNELLWKTNFAKSYLNRFPDLKLVKERRYPYLEDKKLVDQIFLIKKD
jgi:pseudaminic acid biosynthesis-associated methylase